MGTLAVIITIIVAVVALLAIGYNEFRSRNRRSDQKTYVPGVSDVLNRKQDVKDEKKTPDVNSFNPEKSLK